MKKLQLLSILLAVSASYAFSTKHTITNVGTTFSPNDITINVGDTVVFELASAHNAVEVSLSTWNANGNTSNGGFSVPFGGGSVAFPTAGIYYFVCQPHASIGMKGKITVGTVSGINTIDRNPMDMSVFPNPATNNISISYNLNAASNVTIDLESITGARIESILNEPQGAGAQRKDYTIPDMIAPGIYFVRIQAGNDEFVKKVIIK